LEQKEVQNLLDRFSPNFHHMVGYSPCVASPARKPTGKA